MTESKGQMTDDKWQMAPGHCSLLTRHWPLATAFQLRWGQLGLFRQLSGIRRSLRISPPRIVLETIRGTSSVVTLPYQIPWG